jgi:hypothetical protein
VIQFFASASVAKSLTCISGRSENVIMTIHPGPAFTGRVSNLILATDLAIVCPISEDRHPAPPPLGATAACKQGYLPLMR